MHILLGSFPKIFFKKTNFLYAVKTTVSTNVINNFTIDMAKYKVEMPFLSDGESLI